MTKTKQMATGEFEKYQKRGAYHWRQIEPKPFRNFAILSAHYERLLKLGRPWVGRLVLDIGCGDGALTGLIAQEGAIVTGVDISSVGIQLASQEFNKRGLVSNFAIGQDTCLPFSSQSFSIVVMSEVIEHLVKPEQALSEVARILASDGRLILSTPSRMTEDFVDEHYHEYYPAELNELLSKFFGHVSVEQYNPAWMIELYLPMCNTRIAKLPRLLFNLLSYLKRNPFLLEIPSRYFISLAASGLEPIEVSDHKIA